MSGELVIGLNAIGSLFGRSRWTIRRWIEREAFPACKLPNGSWVTDRELIRGWILARRPFSISTGNGPSNGAPA